MTYGGERHDDRAEERGYVVKGRVQGVGFRWWTRLRAEALGVVGNVANLGDGSVRVMARGPADALDHFERELGKGPPSARVDAVEGASVDLPAEASDFRILR